MTIKITDDCFEINHDRATLSISEDGNITNSSEWTDSYDLSLDDLKKLNIFIQKTIGKMEEGK